jgi:competence ComEA-like helix-hairpin-helix protein
MTLPPAARFLLACVPALALASAQSELPDGAGKDAVVKMCVNCHGVEEFIALRLTKNAWAGTVDDMMGRGASGTDAEIATVVQYLVAHFGKKVNVNQATANELKSGLSLKQDDADKIAAARAKDGPFHSLSDLLKIPDIDKAALEQQQANIVF